MRNVAPLVAAMAIVTGFLAATVAAGRVLPSPNLVRMDGYVGPPPSGRREIADLSLRAGQEDVRFQVTAARVVNGGITASQMFQQVRPFRPNFTLRGTPELIAKVAGAAPAARLRMIGTWRRGSRDLFLSSVEALPSAATPPSGNQPAEP
jgi:hypothetical protein